MLSSASHLPRQCQSQTLLNATAGELALDHRNVLLAGWLCPTPAQGCESKDVREEEQGLVLLSDFKHTHSHTSGI